MFVPRLTPSQLISVVIPAYNEQDTLAHVVAKLFEFVSYPLEVIIIDDCSTDDTKDIARKLSFGDPRIVLICHTENLGKTAALNSGFRRSNGEVVIVQDADLEYSPVDLMLLIQPIIDGHADVVYGSRFLDRKTARMAYFYQYSANRFITVASNMMTGLKLSDVETGYKAFRGRIIRNIDIVSNGFGFEVEVTAKIAKLGCSLREVPISYHGRTYAQGKKIRYRDCLAALWFILYFGTFPRSRFFSRRSHAA